MTIVLRRATGNNGGDGIQQFLPQKRPLRGWVRDRSKASHLAAPGSELAIGDLALGDRHSCKVRS